MVSGSPQTTALNTAFASPLVVKVTDQYGNVVLGASVSFVAPSSGDSAVFSNSTNIISGTTNASGQISETLTANTRSGSFSVIASTSGANTPASFSLTNAASAATSIVTASGSPQSGTVNTAYANPLVITVTDQYGNPVPSTSVTFTGPSSGAGGTFSNSSNTITASTNASGQVLEVFTANTQVGGYTVTASASGLGASSFSLTNTPGAAASITATSGSSQSITVNTAFTTSLTATVDDAYGNPLSGVSVSFLAPSSGPGGVFSNSTNLINGTTNASGQVSEIFTASTKAGSYTISAVVNGVNTPASFSLTNAAGAGAQHHRCFGHAAEHGGGHGLWAPVDRDGDRPVRQSGRGRAGNVHGGPHQRQQRDLQQQLDDHHWRDQRQRPTVRRCSPPTRLLARTRFRPPPPG